MQIHLTGFDSPIHKDTPFLYGAVAAPATVSLLCEGESTVAVPPKEGMLPMTTPRQPNPVDIYVGTRLRDRRVELGITQEALAESVPLTFQQIQKYEKGTNRISANRLYQLAGFLDVDPGWFFEGYASNTEPAPDTPEPPPIHWTRLWRVISTLPPDVRQSYIALGHSLAAMLKGGSSEPPSSARSRA